jgi:hypothetical protein
MFGVDLLEALGVLLRAGVEQRGDGRDARGLGLRRRASVDGSVGGWRGGGLRRGAGSGAGGCPP